MSSNPLEQKCPNFLAPVASFMQEYFSMNQGEGIICGWFKDIAFIMDFIPIIIASAPPQIIGH